MKLFGKHLQHKHIIITFIFLNIVLLYISGVFVFMDIFRNISHVQAQTQLASDASALALSNYANIGENRTQLEQLQQMRRVVHYHQLPHTLINISNIMHMNSITKDYYRIMRLGYIQENIFSTNLVIGGTGSHEDIMRYIHDLNQKQDLIFIESVNITQDANGRYSHMNISVSIPATQ
ncbi:MAG: hypothetical protein FWG63_03765 [Defluviitaleaceae bacterium]|nr:hypothetical protein [Defluviitaleaceae bacterium]